jgi:hypothetical protein
MSEIRNTTRCWALLLGINHYVKDRCLLGCVGDVKSIVSYLEGLERGIDITALTATSPSVAGSCQPTEDPNSWPTSANLVSSLKNIIQESCQGDSVYIHYSGHGTQIRQPNKKRSAETPRLAFVLFEPDPPHRSYFRGVQLSKAIQKLVEKGVLVTLVLDCCFSGSIQRGSQRQTTLVRTTDYSVDDDLVHEGDNQTPRGMEDTEDGVVRDSRIVPKWMVDPEGYVVLTACGPHETAEELRWEGGRGAGALSYFLVESLNALRKNRSQVTPHSLYQHLRTRFHVEWPKQVPMRYGKRDFSLFGVEQLPFVAEFTPVFSERDVLYLGAGQAHGVEEGDEYTTYPFEVSEADQEHKTNLPGIARVTKTFALVSELHLVKPSLLATPIRKAKLLSQFRPWRIPVKFSGQDTMGVQLRQETITESLFHVTHDENQMCIFSIEVNEENDFEIRDGSGVRIRTVPTVPISQPQVLQTVTGMIQHLAQYKYLESIENRAPSSKFESLFTITPSHQYGEDGVMHVKHDEDWSLNVQNLGDTALYIAVFNFTDSWRVFNMISECGDGDFMVVPPEDEEGVDIDLIMKVPQFLLDFGHNHCEDIIKIFITSKETAFPSMILPPIVTHELRSTSHDRVEKDGVLKLLSSLVYQSRDSIHHDWASRNFLIRTSYENKIETRT